MVYPKVVPWTLPRQNKHKFVHKVAKKIILLKSFKFSASISFVQTGSKRAIRNQMGPNGSNGVKWGQIGPNGAKQVKRGSNEGQTGVKRGQTGKMGPNGVK